MRAFACWLVSATLALSLVGSSCGSGGAQIGALTRADMTAAAGPRFSAPVLRKDARSLDPVGPVAADLNGDGKPDLATADDKRVSVLVGKGDGSFRKPVAYRTNVEAWAIDVADVNGDDRPDVIVGGNDNDSEHYVVTVLVNDAAGRLLRDQVYAVGHGDRMGSAVAAADANGDGVVDVLVANGWVGDLALLLGTGGGHLAPARKVPGPGGIDLALGDFNGDGKLDFALASFGKNGVRVRLGNGDGTFGPARAFDAAANESAAVTVADLNRDGRLDLVVSTEAGDFSGRGRLILHFGNGDGTFGTRSVYPTDRVADVVVPADFNADGNPDIALATGDTRVAVYSGSGDGTFASRQLLGVRLATSFYGSGGAVADFNSDGRADIAFLAVRNFYVTLGTQVLLNWTGLPAPPCVVVPVTRQPVRVATRDILRAGCRPGNVSYRYSRERGKNRVISQRPRPGAVLSSHARVDLVVSRGRLL